MTTTTERDLEGMQKLMKLIDALEDDEVTCHAPTLSR